GGLAEQQRQPAPLGAAGDALDESARDEQDRGHEADAPGRGQAADEEGEDSHAQQGDDHHGFAADLVSEVAGDEPADRSRDETGGEGRERQERAGDSARIREEDLREDQRGRRAVEEEVVPFDRGADEAGSSQSSV